MAAILSHRTFLIHRPLRSRPRDPVFLPHGVPDGVEGLVQAARVRGRARLRSLRCRDRHRDRPRVAGRRVRGWCSGSRGGRSARRIAPTPIVPAAVARGTPIRTIASSIDGGVPTLPKQTLLCDLEHDRPRPAVVRLQVKSTRAGKPGHPMVRESALCATHARQLRNLGLEFVSA